MRRPQCWLKSVRQWPIRVPPDQSNTDFATGDHLAGRHWLIVGQRRQCNRFIDFVDRIDNRCVEAQNTIRLGEQIGPTRERRVDARMPPGNRDRQGSGCIIFADIASFQARHHDLAMAMRCQES